VTQKGTIRKEIKPIITIGGYEAPLESGLSGGMYSAVELAVDLAAGRVISQRSGVQPGWLVLDESFDGLDVVSKEACLEVLNRFAQDRLVLVADHMSETKGIFTQRITVTFSKGESTV
jgi:ABC-type Mn2+/Zn2+ transport system ATPase subunit